MKSSIPSTLKRTLVSRSTMLTLLTALLGSVLLASLVPQAFLTAEPDMLRWRHVYAAVAPAAEALGLHHVFTTPWFAVILLASLLSMTVSAVDQGKAAWRKTFTASAAGLGEEWLAVAEDDFRSAAQSRGYISLPADDGFRYVKHPWGYWGNFLLHLGLVVTVGSSLLIALTQQRASLVLVKGEPHHGEEPWSVEENGLLAGRFIFPYTVDLVRVAPQFLPSGKASQVSSELTLSDAAGARRVVVAVNDMVSFAGVHIYQSTDFGHAFRVDFTAPGGDLHHFTLPMYHPQSLGVEGFRDFRLPVSPARLEAKYLVDEQRQSPTRGRPVLTLRLVENEAETGRVVLRLGDAGRLGPFGVRLVEVTSWTDIIFVRITGMPGVFAGFGLIILGTICTYCFPPREFRLKKAGEVCLLSWRAERFGDFYAEEREDVISHVAKRQA